MEEKHKLRGIVRDIHLIDDALCPESRSFRLREEYWKNTPGQFVTSVSLQPSSRSRLVGFGENFAARLDASPPAVQPYDMLAGVALAHVPGDRNSFPLGEYDPHYPPGHHNLLRYGFAGIRNRAREKLAEETDPQKRDFLEAAAISYDAACHYAQRNADHARELVEDEEDAQRKEELQRIASVCDEIAAGAPTSFHAALQTFWFTHMFGARGSIGRFDQWMYPFYRRDIDTGVLTQEEAQELLENLWIKLNYFAGNNDSLRNVALGGQTPAGEDASNELTYMCLLATARLKLPEPKLNLRLFKGSPPELLRAGCRTICLGLSQPSIFNDEVAVPALVNIGIPLKIARNYCNDGCSELVTGGVGTSAFGVFGTIPVFNETVRAAAAKSYDTFDEVMDDFKQRLTNFMPNGPRGVRQVTYPFFAASIDDCLEKASPDGVRYTIFSRIPSQLAHVADGLAAIRKYIYEEKSLRWDELIAALDDNYENHAPLRQKLLNRSPKYGNDDDEVDLIIKEIAEYFCDETHRRAQNPYGPGAKQTAGFMNFGIHGQRDVPACPDGRKQGENIPNSFSPALGRDRSGPTAVLKSAAKVDMTKAGHGSVLDMNFTLSALKGPDAFEKFVAFVKTFLELPCTATLQANTLDRNTLLKAKENPDDPQYRTLLVRVWGYSTVFVTLDPALQNHVLERMEHVL